MKHKGAAESHIIRNFMFVSLANDQGKEDKIGSACNTDKGEW
jgi:hypothetical protein